MSTTILEAELRKDTGKGASRRLRRLENKIPAILYGGDKEPVAIHLLHNKVAKALEDEKIYSSIFDLQIDGKSEQVILKDLQRHPYKPVILHMDLQRISAKDILVKNVPIHFINEELSPGARAGGIVTHTMNQVEIRCQAKDLPPFIEVDLINLDLGEVIHLSDLKLPKGVRLASELTDESYDLPVASIHAPRASMEEEEEEKEEKEEKEEAEEGLSHPTEEEGPQ